MRFSPRRAELFRNAYDWYMRQATIFSDSKRGKSFASFGSTSLICFPPTALYGERAIHIGDDTLIGPHVSLSAGIGPDQELLSDRILVIGDRCLIGRGSSIVAHFSIEIGNDVYFGPNVYVTDQNHAFDDLSVPIGRQSMPEKPVVIGDGSWLATNVVVLPGVTIGKHVAVGAGSVVTQDLPDYCVAVGSPAKVVKALDPDSQTDER